MPLLVLERSGDQNFILYFHSLASFLQGSISTQQPQRRKAVDECNRMIEASQATIHDGVENLCYNKPGIGLISDLLGHRGPFSLVPLLPSSNIAIDLAQKTRREDFAFLAVDFDPRAFHHLVLWVVVDGRTIRVLQASHPAIKVKIEETAHAGHF